jgi:ferredoxin
MNDFPVTIWPQGKVVSMNDKGSLLTQLKSSGYDIKSTCGGCASCGDCKVIITAGDANLDDPSFEEKQLIGNVFHITKERLACQTNISGPITIDISAHLETMKPKKATTVRRTRDEASEIVGKRKEASLEKRANKTPRQGGGNKPKAFNFNEEDQAVKDAKLKEEIELRNKNRNS